MISNVVLTKNVNRIYVDIEEGYSREVKSKVADFRFSVEDVAFESVTLGIAARRGDGRGFYGNVDLEHPELSTVTTFMNVGAGSASTGNKPQAQAESKAPSGEPKDKAGAPSRP